MKHMRIEKKTKNSEENGKSYISFLLNSEHNATENITPSVRPYFSREQARLFLGCIGYTTANDVSQSKTGETIPFAI